MREIQGLLQKATQFVALTADPQRFEKTKAPLNAARALALAFELDLSRIDQTAMYLQQVYLGARPVDPQLADAGPNPQIAGPSKLEMSTGDPEKDRLRKIGRDKLRDAQNELSAGHYAQARRMAEELYDAKYGLQDEVQRLLRSIGAEEYNQRVVSTRRTFEAGLDAYVQPRF